jgi:hypothetical protein
MMQTLLTNIDVAHSALLDHLLPLNHLGLHIEVCQRDLMPRLGVQVLSYGYRGCHNDAMPREDSNSNLSETDVICHCGGHYGQSFQEGLTTADILTSKYLDYKVADGRHSRGTWYHGVRPLQYSCILYDASMGTAFVVADSIGSTPIWYSIAQLPSFSEHVRKQIVVTTDAVTAARLGFVELNSLSPSQVVEVNLKSMEIGTIGSLNEYVYDPFPRDAVDSHALQLFARSLSSVRAATQSLNATISSIVVEVDHADSASLLLQCIVNISSIKLAGGGVRFVTRPALVANDLDSMFQDLNVSWVADQVFTVLLSKLVPIRFTILVIVSRCCRRFERF